MSNRHDKRRIQAMLRNVSTDEFVKAAVKKANGKPIPGLAVNPCAGPPQDPLEARLEELGLIVRKAVHNLERQGVHDAGPPIPRGFHYLPCAAWGHASA